MYNFGNPNPINTKINEIIIPNGKRYINRAIKAFKIVNTIIVNFAFFIRIKLNFKGRTKGF